MDLDELAVGVEAALLIERGLRRAGADDGIGGLAEDGAACRRWQMMMASAGKVRISMVRRSMALMPRQTCCAVEDGGEELPVLVLGYFAFGFVAADLLVEGVEKLLAGGGSGEGGAVIEGASEAAEVEEAFGGAVEGDAHAVEQIDDAGAASHMALTGAGWRGSRRRRWCRRSGSTWSRLRPSGSWRR